MPVRTTCLSDHCGSNVKRDVTGLPSATGTGDLFATSGIGVEPGLNQHGNRLRTVSRLRGGQSGIDVKRLTNTVTRPILRKQREIAVVTVGHPTGTPYCPSDGKTQWRHHGQMLLMTSLGLPA
jgi:hypothetical protein